MSDSGAVTPLATIDADDDKQWQMSGFVALTGPLNVQADTVQQVRLRITAEDSQWRVDGVAIDPRVR